MVHTTNVKGLKDVWINGMGHMDSWDIYTLSGII